MRLFEKQKKGDTTLVVDIGSGSVSVALVRSLSSELKPKILFSTTQEIKFQENLTHTHLERAMLIALSRALNEIGRAKFPIPKTCHVFLSSPWLASQASLVIYHKSLPFKFTKSIFNDLLSEQTNDFSQEVVKNNASIIERQVTSILFDEKEVTEPFSFHKEINTVKLSIFFSMSSTSLLSTIRAQISDLFRMNEIIFHSFMASAFGVFRGLFPYESHFLFIDVGDEVTDLGLVKDGGLIDAISFPYGRNAITRSLMRSCNVSEMEASSLFNLYRSAKLDESHSLKIGRTVELVQQEWISAFQSALTPLTKKFVLPSTVFLTTEPHAEEWFTDAVKKEDMHQYFTVKHGFNIIPGKIPLMHEHVLFDPVASRNLFIMIETLFLKLNLNLL